MQAIFKQIPATKVCGNTKESFEEISESSELPPPVELQSQVWLPRLNRSESVWNKHKYKQTKTKTHTRAYICRRDYQPYHLSTIEHVSKYIGTDVNTTPKEIHAQI